MVVVSDAALLEAARLCHEVNRVFSVYTGDRSQVVWDKAPQWQRKSAIAGVQFKINNPKVSAKALHEEWVKKKEKEGWVYGKVKDAEAKTHPSMVPYGKLPKSEKMKDKLFAAIVDTMFADIMGE